MTRLRWLVLWRRKVAMCFTLVVPAVFVLLLYGCALGVDLSFQPPRPPTHEALGPLTLCRRWDVYNAPVGRNNVPCITLAVAPIPASDPAHPLAVVAADLQRAAGLPPADGRRVPVQTFASAEHIAEYMYEHPGEVDMAVVFTAFPGQAANVTTWDYELWVNTTALSGYSNAGMDKLMPGMGVSARRLRAQAAVDAAILSYVGGRPASVGITVGSKPIVNPPERERTFPGSATADRRLGEVHGAAPRRLQAVPVVNLGFIFVRFAAAPFITLGYCIGGFILLTIVTGEKRDGLLGQLRSWGAAESTLWISWLLVAAGLSAATAVVTSIAGYATGMLLFVNTNWFVWFLALAVFGTLVHAYFLSWASHVSRPAYVNLLIFLSMSIAIGVSFFLGFLPPLLLYTPSFTPIGKLFFFPQPWAHFAQFTGAILSVTGFQGSEHLGINPGTFTLGDMSTHTFHAASCGISPNRRLSGVQPQIAAQPGEMWAQLSTAAGHGVVGPLAARFLGWDAAATGSAVEGAVGSVGHSMQAMATALVDEEAVHQGRNLQVRDDDDATSTFGCREIESGTAGSVVGWMLLFTLVYQVTAICFGLWLPSEKSAGQPLAATCRSCCSRSSGSQSATPVPGDTMGHLRATSTSTGSLVAYKVSKVYKSATACSEISMRVDKGQVAALLGVNGSGKSSFLNVIAGVTPMSHGEAFVAGMSVREDMGELRSTLGYCPQATIVWPHLTPFEHMAVVAGVRGLDADAAAQEACQLLQDVSLSGPLAHARVSGFSGGMQRRVQVAMTCLGATSLCVLDEPTAATDPSSRRGIWRLIQRVRADRMVLLASHDMAEVEALADSVAVVHGGRLKAFGSVPHLQATYSSGAQARAVVNVPMSAVLAATPLMAAPSTDLLLALGGVSSVQQLAVGHAPSMVDSTPPLPQVARVLEALQRIPGVEVTRCTDGRTLTITIPRTAHDGIPATLRTLQELTLDTRAAGTETGLLLEWSLTSASMQDVFLRITDAAQALNSGAAPAATQGGAPPPPPRLKEQPESHHAAVDVPLPASATDAAQLGFDAAGHPKGVSASCGAQALSLLALQLRLEAKSWKVNACRCCCFLVSLFIGGGFTLSSAVVNIAVPEYVQCPTGYLLPLDPNSNYAQELTSCKKDAFLVTLLAANSSVFGLVPMWKDAAPSAGRPTPYLLPNTSTPADVQWAYTSTTFEGGAPFERSPLTVLYSDSGADISTPSGGTDTQAALPFLFGPWQTQAAMTNLADVPDVTSLLPFFGDASVGSLPKPLPGSAQAYATVSDALLAAQNLAKSHDPAAQLEQCDRYAYLAARDPVGIANASFAREYAAAVVPDIALQVHEATLGTGASTSSLAYTALVSPFSGQYTDSRYTQILTESPSAPQPFNCSSLRDASSYPLEHRPTWPVLATPSKTAWRGALPLAPLMSAIATAAGQTLSGQLDFAIRPTLRRMPTLKYSPLGGEAEDVQTLVGTAAVQVIMWLILCTQLVFPSLWYTLTKERTSGLHLLMKQTSMQLLAYYGGWYAHCMLLGCSFAFAFFLLGDALGSNNMEHIGPGLLILLVLLGMHASTGLVFLGSALVHRPRTALIVGIMGLFVYTVGSPVLVSVLLLDGWTNAMLLFPPLAYLRAATLLVVYGGDRVQDIAGEPADLATCMVLLFLMGTLALLLGPYLHAVIPYQRGESSRHPCFVCDPLTWRACGLRCSEVCANPADLRFKLAQAPSHSSAAVQDEQGLVSGQSTTRYGQEGVCGWCSSRYGMLAANIAAQRAARAAEVAAGAAPESGYASWGGVPQETTWAGEGEDEDVEAERRRVLGGEYDGSMGGMAALPPLPTPTTSATTSGQDREGRSGAVPVGDVVAPATQHGSPPAGIILKRVSKVYPSIAGSPPTVAVQDLSMAVQYGECTGLLGPNGSGKTTVLSMLSGSQLPSTGGLFVGGHNVVTDVVAAQAVVGVVPQADVMWEDLTVKEHLEFFAGVRGVPRATLAVAARRAAEKVSLDGDAFRKKAKTLSGGQKRKLSLAMALVGEPAILLLDEFTARVDVNTRRFLWDVLLRERAQRQVAVLLSTHSMLEAETLCTRVAVLVRGRLRGIGSPVHLARRFADEYAVTLSFQRAAMGAGGAAGGMASQTLDHSAGGEEGGIELASVDAVRVGMSEAVHPAQAALEWVHANITPSATLQSTVGVTATIAFPRRGRPAPPLQQAAEGGGATAATTAGDGATGDLDMAAALQLLQEAQESLGITAWTLAQSSLEAVFLKMTQGGGTAEQGSVPLHADHAGTCHSLAAGTCCL